MTRIVNVNISGAAPEDGSFIVRGGGFTKRANGQLHGRFTVEVPPGAGHQMTVQAIASTEREAFAQIAALLKGFKGKNAAGAARYAEKIKSKGWQYGGVHGRGSKTVVWQNRNKSTLSAADEKSVKFFAQVFNTTIGDARRVNLRPEGAGVAPRDAVGAVPGNPLLADNRELRTMFGNAEPAMARDPAAIDAYLNRAEETFPGIRDRLAGGNREYQNQEMTYGAMMEQLVTEYYDTATLQEQATIDGAVRHLLEEPSLTRGEIRERLLADSPVDTNASLQLLSVTYANRTRPGVFEEGENRRAGILREAQEAREVFGDVDLPRNGEGVLNLLLELGISYDLDVAAVTGRNRDDLRDHLTYRELMEHLVQHYYRERATEEQREAMETLVKDLLQNDQLTSAEIEALFLEDSPIGKNNSLQLFSHVYKEATQPPRRA